MIELKSDGNDQQPGGLCPLGSVTASQLRSPYVRSQTDATR